MPSGQCVRENNTLPPKSKVPIQDVLQKQAFDLLDMEAEEWYNGAQKLQLNE